MTSHVDVSNNPSRIMRFDRELVVGDIPKDDTWKGEHIIAGIGPDTNQSRSHTQKSRKGLPEFKSTRTKEKDQ